MSGDQLPGSGAAVFTIRSSAADGAVTHGRRTAGPAICGRPPARGWRLLRPVPVRDLADGVQVGGGFGPGVQRGDGGAALDGLAACLAERVVVRRAGLVER